MRNKLVNWFKRVYYCVPLFLLTLNPALSLIAKADSYADSLIGLITESGEDTLKVNLLLQLGKAYLPFETEKAIACGKSALALSNQLDWNGGRLRSNELLGLLYKDIGEFDSSLYYIGLAIQSAEIIQDKKQLAKNYNVYGSLLRRKGYYTSALDYHKNALAISQQLKDTLGIANAYIYLAIINEFTLNYDTAIHYYYQCLRMYESMNNQRNIGVTFLNIGDLFLSQPDYPKAKQKFMAGLRIFEKLGDLRNIGLSCNKLGNVYNQTGSYDSAIFFYHRCKVCYDSIENNSGIAHLHINFGNVYANKGNYDLAYQHYLQAEQAFKKMGFQRGYLNARMSLAGLFEMKGQYQQALESYYKCREIAAAVSPQSLMDVYHSISKLYRGIGNAEKALEFQSLYIQMKDSVFQLEKIRTIADVELKYEKEKDQARILLMEKENLEKDVALERRTRQRNTYLYSGGGVVLFLVFLFSYYNQRTRKNRVIAEQRIHQLEEEKKLLAARSLVEGQEEERKRIARELHDGLGVLLSSAKLHFTTIRDKSPESQPMIDMAAKLLEQATGDVRRISHNMMPGLLTKFGFYDAVEDLIEQVGEMEGMEAMVTIEGLQTRLNENTEIMLYRIIQEMVNNTLKHADAKNIRLLIIIRPDHLAITYSDDGEGFDVEEKLKAKSLGLTSIQSRAKFLAGTSRIESGPGQGTTYNLWIPTQNIGT